MKDIIVEEEVLIEDERHPIRFLVKVAIFVGLLYGVGRFLAQKKNEFAGLTETEARKMFVERAGPKIGEDTAEEIADQVIPKLKERGLLKSDPMDDAVEDAKEKAADLEDDAKEKADEAIDAVSDAVDSVVKD